MIKLCVDVSTLIYYKTDLSSKNFISGVRTIFFELPDECTDADISKEADTQSKEATKDFILDHIQWVKENKENIIAVEIHPRLYKVTTIGVAEKITLPVDCIN